MKFRMLIASALAVVGLGVGVNAAQAYLVYQGVWDVSTASTLAEVNAKPHGTDCFVVNPAVEGANYLCETKRDPLYMPHRLFDDKTYQVVHTTQNYVGSLDNSWTCYNNGRVAVNVRFTCFKDVVFPPGG